jgi:hypothetical protein
MLLENGPPRQTVKPDLQGIGPAPMVALPAPRHFTELSTRANLGRPVFES